MPPRRSSLGRRTPVPGRTGRLVVTALACGFSAFSYRRGIALHCKPARGALFDFDDDQHRDTDRDDDESVRQDKIAGPEDVLHEWQISEQELRKDDDADTGPDDPVTQCAGQRQRSAMRVADAEEVKNLHNDERIDDHRAPRLDRQTPRLAPEEDAESAGNEEERDEYDAPHQSSTEYRRAGRARRAVHRAALGRFEGERKPERDGRDHVDP